MNIDETLEMRDKILEKLRCVCIKLPISQLLCNLVYQTWCQINAWT